jgi:amino-acid N-acetyltransferase
VSGEPNLGPDVSAAEAVPLLVECGLPVTDISPAAPPLFFGIREAGVLAAVVGLEVYAPVGLLRSLAVRPAFRDCGFGRALVARVESFAAARGVESLYLLTTTAERFFAALGYAVAARDAAPAAIRATSQFAGLCPASSAFLSKRLRAPDGSGR